MKIDYFQCAETVIVDQLTNKVSLIGIVDHVKTASFPFLFRNFYIALAFTREPAEPEQPPSRGLIKLDDTEIASIDIDVNFQGHIHTRAFVAIDGLLIEKPGTLKITLTVDENIMGVWQAPISAQVHTTATSNSK